MYFGHWHPQPLQPPEKYQDSELHASLRMPEGGGRPTVASLASGRHKLLSSYAPDCSVPTSLCLQPPELCMHLQPQSMASSTPPFECILWLGITGEPKPPVACKKDPCVILEKLPSNPVLFVLLQQKHNCKKTGGYKHKILFAEMEQGILMPDNMPQSSLLSFPIAIAACSPHSTTQGLMLSWRQRLGGQDPSSKVIRESRRTEHRLTFPLPYFAQRCMYVGCT